jgi:acylglycerol lipase
VHTPSDQGLTGPTTQVLSDINEFILSVASPLPLFLMGHSMGGGQALYYLLTTAPPSLVSTRPRISGLILEAPYIALDPSSEPHWIVVSAGKLAAKLLPTKQMMQKLPAQFISRSPRVQQDWTDDKLNHDTGTLGGLAGMLQRSGDLVRLSEGAHVANLTTRLPCPLWLGHGNQDKLTSYTASKRVYDVLEAEGGDKTFKTYEGGYHKLHGEPDGMGEEFARDVGEWVVSRAKGPVERAGSPDGGHAKL